MAVSITTDRACDLFPDLYLQRDIGVVPLYISLEGQNLRDVFEASPDDLFESFSRTHKLPTTAAPAPADFFALFQKYTAAGNDIVHLAMNGKFSSSYQNAVLAAQKFPNVYVADTCTLSSALGLLCLRAADLRDAGASAKEIYEAMLRDKEKIRTHVLLDTLEYAYKGGRATMLQMFGANLLKLRPCLLLDHRGDLSVVKKFRGNFAQAAREYARYVLARPHIDGERAFVSTTGMDGGLFAEIVSTVRDSHIFREVLTSRAGCAMSCHTGPNTLVIFYKEQD